MSDVDPTPETPTTIGDRMGWWRGDMQAQFVALSQKLDALTTQITTLNTTLSLSLGVTNEKLTGIYSLFDPGNGITPYNLLDLIRTALISPQGYTVAELLQYIDSVLGGYPYGDMELSSIRSWLFAIMQNQQRIGIMPDTSIGNYAQSTGTNSFDGFRYIVWGSISGVTRSSDNMQLTPESSWTGYQVYVQTDAPVASLFDKTDPQFDNNAFAANTWITLGGNHSFIFGVPSIYDVTGIMRVPASPFDCESQSGYELVFQIDSRSWASAEHDASWLRLFTDVIDYSSNPITEIMVRARAIEPEQWCDYAGFAWRTDNDAWVFQLMTDFNTEPKTYHYTRTPNSQSLQVQLYCTNDISPTMAICVFVKH